MSSYYFLRVNGNTAHNDPGRPNHYVPGEPPPYPQTYFNYLAYCFENDIARIGWPDTGDLRAVSKTGALARGYDLGCIKKLHREYLETFVKIANGSVILVPDKDHSGDVYICTVTRGYHYYHQVPDHPYECAHRLGVRWDRDHGGQPISYHARHLNISNQGGFWMRAFHALNDSDQGMAAIPFIQKTRERAAG